MLGRAVRRSIQAAKDSYFWRIQGHGCLPSGWCPITPPWSYVQRIITQRDSTHSIWVKVPDVPARAVFLTVISRAH